MKRATPVLMGFLLCAASAPAQTESEIRDRIVGTKAAAADGSFAYCGRYEIDVKQRQIVHLPEVATNPGYVGSRQIRPYTFEGGRLVLGEVEKDDPEVARWKIVWEKTQAK